MSVVARVHGHPVTLNVPTAILDLSEGGFLLQSPVAFPVGATEEFRFTAGEVDVILSARVVRVLTATQSDGVFYLTGLEFLEGQRESIRRLLATVLVSVSA
jgi:hypothetical protein